MTKACPNCNQPNPSEAAFCLNCAAALSPAPHIGGAPKQPFAGGQIGGQSQASGDGQKAVIALVLAIVAFLCCGPFAGIPAAILGWMELDAIKNGRSPADKKWMAMVGLWGGIVATIGHAVFYIFWVGLSMFSQANPYGY